MVCLSDSRAAISRDIRLAAAGFSFALEDDEEEEEEEEEEEDEDEEDVEDEFAGRLFLRGRPPLFFGGLSLPSSSDVTDVRALTEMSRPAPAAAAGAVVVS